jgi:DNA-binding CsgD family transcriptional regulator
MMMSLLPREVSIDQLMGQDGSMTLEACLVDPDAESQERTTYRKELVALVRGALAKLNERERHIIRSRFGILGGDEHSLEEIAAGLNLSRERVRQLEGIAKTKLLRVLGGCSPSRLVAGIGAATPARFRALQQLQTRVVKFVLPKAAGPAGQAASFGRRAGAAVSSSGKSLALASGLTGSNRRRA